MPRKPKMSKRKREPVKRQKRESLQLSDDGFKARAQLKKILEKGIVRNSLSPVERRSLAALIVTKIGKGGGPIPMNKRQIEIARAILSRAGMNFNHKLNLAKFKPEMSEIVLTALGANRMRVTKLFHAPIVERFVHEVKLEDLQALKDKHFDRKAKKFKPEFVTWHHTAYVPTVLDEVVRSLKIKLENPQFRKKIFGTEEPSERKVEFWIAKEKRKAWRRQRIMLRKLERILAEARV